MAYVLGTVVSGSCLVGDVALALRPRGTVDSPYRRLQRSLDNQQVTVADLQGEWAQMVIRCMQPKCLTLLVDETALSDHLKIMVVFRVQSTTCFRAADGREYALAELGVKGKSWQAAGEVFKNADWLSATASVAWGTTYDAPLCLVSSQAIDPHLYAQRFDQEVSFRDFKSDGFQWQRSHVWLPDHIDRLLLVIAIAYWLVMSVGQLLAPAPSGRASRWSCFRRGWEACCVLFRPTIAVLLPPPVPPLRFRTSVVY